MTLSGVRELPAPLEGEGKVCPGIDVARTYRGHAGFVWRILRSLGVPEDWVDDAAQEVFLVACRRGSEIRDPDRIRSWLFSICRRVSLKMFRQIRRGSDLTSQDLWHAPAKEPDEELARRQTGEVAAQILAGMDEGKRMVLVLSDLEGMSGPEIAEAMSLKLNTVYSRLRTARLEFDRRLQERTTGVTKDDETAEP